MKRKLHGYDGMKDLRERVTDFKVYDYHESSHSQMAYVELLSLSKKVLSNTLAKYNLS